MLPFACAWHFGDMEPDGVERSCNKELDLAPMTGAGTPSTTIHMTRQDFNLKFVGTCSLFPCGDHHGGASCVRQKIQVVDGGYGLQLFTSSVSLCMCSHTGCTMDHFTCNSFSKWNASLSAREKRDPNYFHNTVTDKNKILEGATDFLFGMVCLGVTALSLSMTARFIECMQCNLERNKCWGRMFFIYKFFKSGETPDDFICGIRKGKILYYVLSVLLMYIPFTTVFKPNTSMHSICESAMDPTLNTEYLVSAFFFWVCAEFSWKADSHWFGLEGPAVLAVSALYRDVVALEFREKLHEYAKLFQLTARLQATNLVLLVLAQRDFTAAMVWIILVSMVRASFQLRRFFTKKHGDFYAEWKALRDSDKEPDEKVVSVTPTDCYQHAATPIGKKVLIIFFAQVFLFGVYVLAMRNDSHDMLCKNDINWNLARITVVIQLVLSLNQGNQFEVNLKEWAAFMYARSVGAGTEYDIKIKPTDTTSSAIGTEPRRCTDVYVKIRFVMSWLVNAVIFDLLISTAFLTLIGNDDPLDYVKDCLAIGFITQLDDLPDDDKLEGFYYVEVETLIENYETIQGARSAGIPCGACGGGCSSLGGALKNCCGAARASCGRACRAREPLGVSASDGRGHDYEALDLD